ncbi:MAG: DUF2309 domain-containing protein [Gammaproteobacteria bacterium]
MRRLSRTRWHMPLSWYRDAWRRGDIASTHLRAALREFGPEHALGTEAMTEALADESPEATTLPLLSEIVMPGEDAAHRPDRSGTILHQVSQHCASYFDRRQADWRPAGNDGLYTTWRRAMIDDHGVSFLMDMPAIPRRARELPEDAGTAIAHAVEVLGVPGEKLADWLEAVLLRINGWASWCAWLRWQARLDGGDDNTIVELLAVRAAWELLIDDGARDPDSVWTSWQSAWRTPTEVASPVPAAVWQRACEIAFQEPLGRALAENGRDAGRRAVAVEAQAVFCIDVRSEVIRRHLEAVRPGIETKGFAGFFGLPVSYTPIGTDASRPHLPGLLAPAMAVTEGTGDAERDVHLSRARRERLQAAAGWREFLRLPASAFTLVESLGLGYVTKILRRSIPRALRSAASATPGLREQEARSLRPRLHEATPDERTKLAAGVLRAMDLTEGMAPIVLLVGHGSRTANNPHAAALDCGACCGQTGEVNARTLAGLLNDTTVRNGLAGEDIHIPKTTWFVAALHNTTTDDVEILDRDSVPEAMLPELRSLQNALAEAGHRSRAERAPALGLGRMVDQPESLAAAVRRRSDDWSLTRPEWGLADNAAFIVAPRGRSRGLDLGGRAFLHDYDWRRDTDNSVLELIMTAPMIVTHWINLQYYASTVDNERYGSGNKVLHNVVGGCIGVFEGNGGDLRIGLPLQSVHDGERWMHTPLRLSVYIEAPREKIERVIADHAVVRQLLDNRWLYLFRMQEDTIEAWRGGQWKGAGLD